MSDPTYEELLAARRTQDENARIVKSALDAFNGGDTETFLGHFTDSMHFKMSPTRGSQN